MTDGKVSVRYMVDDVDEAIGFYTEHFGFELGHNASPAFAEVLKGNLRLLLAGPASFMLGDRSINAAPLAWQLGGWGLAMLLAAHLLFQRAVRSLHVNGG